MLVHASLQSNTPQCKNKHFRAITFASNKYTPSDAPVWQRIQLESKNVVYWLTVKCVRNCMSDKHNISCWTGFNNIFITLIKQLRCRCYTVTSGHVGQITCVSRVWRASPTGLQPREYRPKGSGLPNWMQGYLWASMRSFELGNADRRHDVADDQNKWAQSTNDGILGHIRKHDRLFFHWWWMECDQSTNNGILAPNKPFWTLVVCCEFLLFWK